MSSRFGSRTDSGIIRDFIESSDYDPDAQAYFTANTAITSAADKNAINTFYLGLKSDGIYTKIKAMYLPIWGSAASSKWNLINNRSFDLSFSVGGMTFTSGGMTSDGTSGYANTNLIPNTNLTNNSTSFGVYCRTNSDGIIFDCGTQKTTAPTGYMNLLTKYNSELYSDQYDATTNRIKPPNADSRGFFQSIRTTSTIFKVFKNNAQLGSTNTNVSTGFSNLIYNFYISALNVNNAPLYYSTRQYSFAYIGDGLTDTEASNFNTRVQTLMTYFGINV